MKKFLSILIVAAMLVSMIIVSTVSVAAVQGDWSAYADKYTYADDSSTVRSVPGYEYTDDGFHIIPANWETTAPWACAQTTDPVDLREGVYMEVRVDDFTYSAGDRWFAFEIWEHPVNVYAEDDMSQWNDYGGEILMRMKVDTTGEGEEKVTTYNSVNSHEFWTYLNKGQRIKVGGGAPVNSTIDAEGRPTLSLEIIYDAGNESYTIFANGLAAPDAFNIAITQYFSELDHQAYITFSSQNSTKGGTVEYTITKFGTSKDTASTPVGDDSADPIDNSVEFAEIADPATVEEGAPAIMLNGSPDESAIAVTPSSYMGNIIEIQEDYATRVYANAEGWLSASYKVNADVSYDAKDFPIMALIARNFCTCADKNACALTESFSVLVLAGDVVQEASQYSTTISSASWEPDYVGEDSYMLLCGSWEGFEGRINGFRLDCNKMQVAEGRNLLDICEVLFFRTEDDAQAYYAAYLAELTGGEVTPPENETTEAPVVETTEAPVNETTEAPVVDTEEPTDAPTEAPTQAPVVEDPTEAPTQAPAVEDPTDAAPKTEEPKSGCGSVVGIGAIAVVAFAAAGLVSFKKKED